MCSGIISVVAIGLCNLILLPAHECPVTERYVDVAMTTCGLSMWYVENRDVFYPNYMYRHLHPKSGRYGDARSVSSLMSFTPCVGQQPPSCSSK